MTLSPKAVICASQKQLAKFLRAELHTHGLQYKLEKYTRDLGITFAAGNAKLNKVKAVTETKIKALRESGVEVNNKQYQKLLLVLEGINTAMKKNLNENELASAEVLLAAKQMADDLQKMAENLDLEGIASDTRT